MQKFSGTFKSKNFLILPKYAYFEFKRAEPGTAPVIISTKSQNHITYISSVSKF